MEEKVTILPYASDKGTELGSSQRVSECCSERYGLLWIQIDLVALLYLLNLFDQLLHIAGIIVGDHRTLDTSLPSMIHNHSLPLGNEDLSTSVSSILIFIRPLPFGCRGRTKQAEPHLSI